METHAVLCIFGNDTSEEIQVVRDVLDVEYALEDSGYSGVDIFSFESRDSDDFVIHDLLKCLNNRMARFMLYLDLGMSEAIATIRFPSYRLDSSLVEK